MPANSNQDPFPSEKEIREALTEGGRLEIGPVEANGGLLHVVGALVRAMDQTKLRRPLYSAGRVPTAEELGGALSEGLRLNVTLVIEATTAE